MSQLAGAITERDVRQWMWDLYHRPWCVLYEVDGTVTECVSCGSVRP